MRVVKTVTAVPLQRRGQLRSVDVEVRVDLDRGAERLPLDPALRVVGQHRQADVVPGVRSALVEARRARARGCASRVSGVVRPSFVTAARRRARRHPGDRRLQQRRPVGELVVGELVGVRVRRADADHVRAHRRGGAAPVLATKPSVYSPGARSAASGRSPCTASPSIEVPIDAPAGKPGDRLDQHRAALVEVDAVSSNVSCLPIVAAKRKLSGASAPPRRPCCRRRGRSGARSSRARAASGEDQAGSVLRGGQGSGLGRGRCEAFVGVMRVSIEADERADCGQGLPPAPVDSTGRPWGRPVDVSFGRARLRSASRSPSACVSTPSEASASA